MRLAVIVFVLLPTIVNAQSRDQFDAMVRWQNATKLSLDPVPSDLPQPNGGSDFEKMKTGDVGNFAYWDFKITQIIDEKNMMLVLGLGKRIWLEGFPTDGLADGQSVRLVGLCRMTGTKQYENVAGSTTTVRVFKMLSDKQRQEWEQELQQQEHERAEQIRLQKMEKFTAKTGHSVEARFVNNRGTLITLETREGQKITVQLSVFSDESADRIRELIREARSKNP